jgi:hypothetical protein
VVCKVLTPLLASVVQYSRVRRQARQDGQTSAIISNKDFRDGESAKPALAKKGMIRVGWSCTKDQFREENVVDRCKEVLTSCTLASLGSKTDEIFSLPAHPL